MKRYELIVIGAGPAGLSAAIEGAKAGMRVAVFDENARPGGQLFKQIHKFFGSKEHKAKIRGFRIGEMLLKEAEEAGVNVQLNATVLGIFRKSALPCGLPTMWSSFPGTTSSLRPARRKTWCCSTAGPGPA